MYFRLENKRIKRKVQKIGSRKNRQVESLQERKDVRNSMDRPEKLTNVKCGPTLVRKVNLISLRVIIWLECSFFVFCIAFMCLDTRTEQY